MHLEDKNDMEFELLSSDLLKHVAAGPTFGSYFKRTARQKTINTPNVNKHDGMVNRADPGY